MAEILYRKKKRKTSPDVMVSSVLRNMRYIVKKVEVEDYVYKKQIFAVKPDGTEIPIKEFVRGYAAAAVEKALKKQANE